MRCFIPPRWLPVRFSRHLSSTGVFLLWLGALTAPASAADVSRAAVQAGESANGIFVLAPQPGDHPLVDLAVARPDRMVRAEAGVVVQWMSDRWRVHNETGRHQFGFGVHVEPALLDLSGHLYVAVDVCNRSPEPIVIVTRVEDPKQADWHHFAEGVMRLPAGKTGTALVFLKRKPPAPAEWRKRFPGMHGLPGGYMPIWSGLDPSRVSAVRFQIESATTNAILELTNLRATGLMQWPALEAGGTNFFPFVDRFGQYRHAEWVGKVHSPADLVAHRRAEAEDLQASPGPADWDSFGGWKTGLQRPATGSFRVEKLNGKWWLVDPEGHLFWSHGVTCVSARTGTGRTGREHFFEPPSATAPAEPRVDFYAANLRLKYGSEADLTALQKAHERLRSWGLNTLGAWSSPEAVKMRRTPYAKVLYFNVPTLAPGLHLPDMFNPAFRETVRMAVVAERDASGQDPWCIGYFVANELEWRNGPEVVPEILAAPTSSAGKRALVEFLQTRHADIRALNETWGTRYESWSDLLASTNRVALSQGRSDFAAFNEELAERYFRITNEELKRALPHRLNLGARFHTGNPAAIRAAARHADVVSFNKYATSVRSFDLPDGLDRPVLIGEFHFPAWDRSFTASPGRSELSLAQRADAYWYYVAGALDNPHIVGVHWFQYVDQPITGRGDGENWPVGFVDTADVPYASLVAAAREIGRTLYVRRMAAER